MADIWHSIKLSLNINSFTDTVVFAIVSLFSLFIIVGIIIAIISFIYGALDSESEKQNAGSYWLRLRKYIVGESDKEIEDRVIIVDSISKRYSACGARIGCIISKNRVLMQSIYRLCQARLCVPTLEMIGAAALYTIDDSYLETVRLEYEKRRGILYEELCKIDGVVVGQPEGAFYSVVKLPIENAEDFAMWLLKEYELNGETILITPAEGFYKTEGAGRNEIRISYAIEEEKIRTAMNILKQALSAYKS